MAVVEHNKIIKSIFTPMAARWGMQSNKEVVAVDVTVIVFGIVLVVTAVIELVSIVVVAHVLVPEAVARMCTCSCRTGIVVGGVGEEQG